MGATATAELVVMVEVEPHKKKKARTPKTVQKVSGAPAGEAPETRSVQKASDAFTGKAPETRSDRIEKSLDDFDPSPAEVVEREVIASPDPVSFIILSMDGIDLSVQAKWIREFIRTCLAAFRLKQWDAPIPSVIVFTPDLPFAQRSILHDAGAIVIPASSGIKNAEGLGQWLRSKDSTSTTRKPHHV